MQFLEGGLVLSASDLTGFAACEHLTQLELSAARGERKRPTRDDPMLDVLSRRGGEHETNHVARLRAAGSQVVEITGDARTRSDLHAAEATTVEAMRTGADVIYQATFFDGRWRGHADFLLRVAEPSELGPWSYEVADTKLARRVKAAALLQMCEYSDHVSRLQGTTPGLMHVITGDGEQHPFVVSDYAAYHRTLKARYEELVFGPVLGTYPDPVEHCGICRWADECKRRRRADDHLSLVSGMRRDQSHKLVAAGIGTRDALATTGVGTVVPGIGDESMLRLRHQAELQVRGEGREPPIYELLPPERPEPIEPAEPAVAPDATDVSASGLAWPQRGWAALPVPSAGDLFFDMEGDPYALDGGLEYLFGVIELVDGAPKYHAFWAHDRAAEKTAFEAFVDFVTDQRAKHPDMHIYHYAPYEPSAAKRLMGAHDTREREVDELLRAEVFVDLYAVVRRALRIGLESYSLKQVEKLYMDRPSGEVMDAGSSIVAYEDYLQDGDVGRLEGIQTYNEGDCRSTLLLHRWLEARRTDAESRFGPIPRPTAKDGAASEKVDARATEVMAIADRLLEHVPDRTEDRDDDQQARWLLAQMLDWHRRESKPDWWNYFARLRLSDDELADDRECLGGLEPVGEVGTIAKSTVWRYEFAPQDHKFGVGSTPIDPLTRRGAGQVVAIDDVDGWIDLKRGPKLMAGPHPRGLIPAPPIDSGRLESAITRVAEWVVTNGMRPPGPYLAARDLLLRTPRAPGSAPFSESYLAIQGPPGSGKTYAGAELILGLLRDGKRVGVTAHSHAVIGNLLEAVGEHAARDGVTVHALQKAEDHQRCTAGIVECVDSYDVVEEAAGAGTYDIIAGTSWLWAREGMAGAVDVLFVDEAGQKSLADVIAVSGATRQLVLLGDPQQLAQPSKGSHPQGSEVSALEHLLGGEPTMPESLGWFLATTHRMHPAVCAFVSEVAYERKLHSEPGLEHQAVDGFAGLRFVPVAAAGNRSWSAEEADVVDTLVRDLVGRPWVDRFGTTRKLDLDDVLVVTPYNAQVAKLAIRLPAGARVGTVDKFQGQEAAVTIYSMATSSADDAPRAMEFLYDLHRLNVAVSRARAESIIVANPELLRVQCRTPQQMLLANALCRFVERSAEAFAT
jgi:predicted RecB family nuclease